MRINYSIAQLGRMLYDHIEKQQVTKGDFILEGFGIHIPEDETQEKNVDDDFLWVDITPVKSDGT